VDENAVLPVRRIRTMPSESNPRSSRGSTSRETSVQAWVPEHGSARGICVTQSRRTDVGSGTSSLDPGGGHRFRTTREDPSRVPGGGRGSRGRMGHGMRRGPGPGRGARRKRIRLSSCGARDLAKGPDRSSHPRERPGGALQTGPVSQSPKSGPGQRSPPRKTR